MSIKYLGDSDIDVDVASVTTEEIDLKATLGTIATAPKLSFGSLSTRYMQLSAVNTGQMGILFDAAYSDAFGNYEVTGTNPKAIIKLGGSLATYYSQSAIGVAPVWALATSVGDTGNFQMNSGVRKTNIDTISAFPATMDENASVVLCNIQTSGDTLALPTGESGQIIHINVISQSASTDQLAITGSFLGFTNLSIGIGANGTQGSCVTLIKSGASWAVIGLGDHTQIT